MALLSARTTCAVLRVRSARRAVDKLSSRVSVGGLNKAAEIKNAIKEDILAAIKPLTKSYDIPDLSAAELIVMAVLCSDKEEMRYQDVTAWMMQTFPSFMSQAMTAFHERCTGGIYMFDDRAHVRQLEITQAAWNYDNPIKLRYVTNDWTLRVDPYEGRVFLRHLLEPKQNGIFRFLDLPVEIRITIYEYVLSFPASGLGFHGLDRNQYTFLSRDSLEIQRAAKFEDGDATTKQWSIASRGAMSGSRRPNLGFNKYVHAPSMNKILAILSVNKQIHKEALPYFYRCNHFHADDLFQLQRLLSKCGRNRRQYFTSISFGYGPPFAKTKPKICFNLLAKTNNLRFLQIEANDADEPKNGFPAVAELKQVRAQKVEFLGDCPKLQELKVIMEEAKVEEDVTQRKCKQVKKVTWADIALGNWVITGRVEKRKALR